MSDDIVTRLREYNPVKGFINWDDTMRTAADEIERLRADCEHWRNTADKLARMMTPFSLLMNKQEQEELITVLRQAVPND
jgi:hypothetical protein